MKKAFAATLVFLVFFISPMYVALAGDCSRTAPDGSYSASVSCPEGCLAICSPGGRCTAECVKGGGVLPEKLTLQMANSDSRQLSF